MGSRYRFGDGRQAPFTGNALRLLEEAVGVCVAAAAYAEDLGQVEGGAAAMEQRLAQTSEQLRLAADRCVAHLRRETSGQPPIVTTWARAVIKDIHRRVEEQEQTLQGEIESHVARHRKGLESKRVAFLGALARFLAHVDLPQASDTLTVEAQEHAYLARRSGHSSWGLSWSVTSPTTSCPSLSSALRVRDLVPDLAVETGAQGGVLDAFFGRGDVGRLTVLRLERSFPKTRLSLGAKRGARSELDVVFGGPGSVFVLRHDPEGEPQLEVLAAEVRTELERLRDPIDAVLREVRQVAPSSVEVELDDQPIDTVERVEILVTRIVEAMAPLAHEISRRSPHPDELVLKEAVGAGERRELFLARQQLAGPVAELPVAWRERIGPLVVAPSPSSSQPLTMVPSSEHESTPAGPRSLPQLYEAESERTAHGYSAPDVPPAAPPSNTKVSASYDEGGEG